jgi:putative ABC transport system permease protein
VLKSYFLVAFQHLAKQKLFTLINVVGLAVGLACFILIALFVRHEWSYDRQFANAERIYRVSRDFLPTEMSKAAYLATMAPQAAPLLKEDFPEIEQVARILPGGGALRAPDGQVYSEPGLVAADPELFDIFDFRWLRGDPRTALESSSSLVLTESLARKYFGDADPIGQTLVNFGTDALEVTGVIADLGDDTHLRFTALRLMPQGLLDSRVSDNWGFNAFYTYVLLKEGASAAALRAGSDAFFERRFLGGSSRWTRYDVIALEDIHLRSHKENEMRAPGSAATVQTFVAIAVFILLLACINFMNLATARATQRAKEIGVRKVVGAERAQVVAQFLTESVLVAVIALVLALAIVELALPTFNALLGQSISLRYFDSPGEVVALVGLTLATGLLAGSYPAFYLAAFEPGKVLKGDVTRGGGAALFRRVLVVLQFSISIALLIATAVVYRQNQFARDIELGFDKEQILVVDGSWRGGLGTQWEALKREWLANPDVTQVTASNLVPGMENTDALAFRAEGHDPDGGGITNLWVDYGFFETYGIEVTAGRSFDERFADRPLLSAAEGGQRAGTYVVNELAAKRWGWTPEEAIGKWLENTFDSASRGPIVGVVKDVHFESVRSTIEPTVYLLPPLTEGRRYEAQPLRFASLRLAGRNLRETLERIDETWAELMPEQPISRHFLDQDFEALYQAERRQGQMFTFFAALAILIACLGLFGLAAFTTERRTKEIGIRKAVGGSVVDIVGMFCGEFGKLVLVANVIAWPVAYFLMQRWLSAFAYRVDISLWVYVASATAALAIAIATVGAVAARAAMRKPVSALRYE